MTRHLPLTSGWKFRRLGDASPAADTAAEEVELPHSAFVADLDGNDPWTGLCEYTRILEVPSLDPDAQLALHVGAAMHSLTVSVDGVVIGEHFGGYLPTEFDLTSWVHGRTAVALTLRLDNRDNPDIPPGKLLADLDFCWYGGLYREVELRIRPAIHITDAVGAHETAGGGVFIRTSELEPGRAVVQVRGHVRNLRRSTATVSVRAEATDPQGRVTHTTTSLDLPAAGAAHAELTLEILDPQPWSPDSPALYRVRLAVSDEAGVVLDQRVERFGIRRIAFSRSGGFQINGRRVRLRGTNRHQEYPYAGYALPRAAHYRDARRIKEAGFDYVRLAHYPQSPHFLDACDELGIVVMNAIPGWQFVGGSRFCELCERNVRDLVRRDRNHPCVVLWELSLNETAMPEELMVRMHQAGHEEYPGDQMFTCGWIDRYDVFIHSRQHGQIHTWRNGDKALVVAEYGDWEFYAMNEGFDQKTGSGVFDRWSNSRHFRGEGERALRQQAWNHTLALNDTLACPAVLDGQWAVFDYARGYDPVRAACGVMDVFRIPKFSYWFYRSQRDPSEGGAGWQGGAVVFIASHWTPRSDLRVVVFSNCEEVELRLNGKRLARARPASAWMTQHLPHPPFIFDLAQFTPGSLEAFGYIAGTAVATHRVQTPGESRTLEVVIDSLHVPVLPGESDLVIAHAHILDAAGTPCAEETARVAFSIEGGAVIVGPCESAAEAGIASIVVRVPARCRGFVLHARTAAGLSASQEFGDTRGLALAEPTR